MSIRVSIILVRFLLAGVLLWSAGHKLASGPPSTSAPAATIYDDWAAWSPAIRLGLFTVEIVLAVWLVTGRWRSPASLTFLVLIASFSGAVVVELMADRPRPCGCFGSGVPDGAPAAVRAQLIQALLRNGGLSLAAAWLFFTGLTPADRPRPARGPTATAGPGHVVPGSSLQSPG